MSASIDSWHEDLWQSELDNELANLVSRYIGLRKSSKNEARHDHLVDEIRSLLKSGADINVIDYQGATPIFQACHSNAVKLARTLIDLDCDIEAEQPDGTRPLLVAAQWGSNDVAELLLAAGAKPDVCNEFGETAITVAESKGNDILLDRIRQRYVEPALLSQEPDRGARPSGMSSL